MKNLKVILSTTFLFSLLFPFALFGQDYSSWLEDVTETAFETKATGSRVLLIDVNGDDYPDLLWGTGNLNKNRYSLFLNVPGETGSRKFVDFTEESGINANRDPEKEGRIVDVAGMADLDNDGDPDLVTSIYYHRLQMYLGDNDPGDRSEVLLNDGTGRFTLVENNGLHDMNVVDSLSSGLINATGLAFIDYDLDGFLDVYFSTWFTDYKANLEINNFGYKMQDVLFKGNGDGTFTRVLNSGIERIEQPMYGVNATDWNNDGWQDIITSPYCRSRGSLFANQKNGTFVDAAIPANYDAQEMQGDHGQNLCQWEAQPGDFDNDGDVDLLVVNVHGGYDANEGRTHILINQGEENDFRFVWDNDRIVRDAPSYSHLGDQGAQWFDLDGDGLLDLAIGQMGYEDANFDGQLRLYICRQNSEGIFQDISKALGIYEMQKDAHSMEPADYDLDGDQDLFFSRLVRDTSLVDTIIDGEPQTIEVYDNQMTIFLLENKIGNSGTWSSVKLDQPAEANQSGIGSRITFHYGDVAIMREIQNCYGHFAGMQPTIRNAGLGDANRIDSIVVRYPNSDLQTTTVYNPPTNVILKIGEEGLIDFLRPWEGDRPIIAFDKPVLRNDKTNVGETETLSFNVKNIGADVLTIDDIYFKTNEDDVFSIQDYETPFTIEPGASQPIEVEFEPVRRHLYVGELSFSSDAENHGVKSMDVEAYGFEQKPLIASNVESIEFEPIWLEDERKAEFEIENPGELTLYFGDYKIDGDSEGFSVTGLEDISSLEPGESVTVEVTFAPPEIKTYEAELTIVSNAYENETYRIALSGVCDGPLPEIWVSMPNIFFGSAKVGEIEDRPLEITNNGNADLKIESIDFESFPEAFYITPEPTYPWTIPSGETREIVVNFAPPEEENYDDVMIIKSNAFEEPELEISLRARGSGVLSVFDSIDPADFAEISVIENPVENLATFQVRLDPQVKSAQLSICDETGNIVGYRKINGVGEKEIEFDFSAFPQGAYYAYLVTEYGIVAETLIKVR